MLPVVGPISMSQVNQERGLAATAATSLNDSGVRSLFGVPSGANSMQSGRGKYLIGPAILRGSMNAIVRFGSFTYVTLDSAIYRFSSPTDRWTLVYSGIGAFRMAANGSRIVAINNFGTGVVTSTDGTTWSTGTLPASIFWRGLDASSSTFVAVGASGTIATSTDGISWTTRTSNTTNSLQSVAWSGSQFLVVGANSTLRTSTDGITWTTQTYINANSFFNNVAWGAGVFVANTSAGVIASSPTGATGTWTVRVTGAGNGQMLVFTGTQFIYFSSFVYRTSSNGTSWTGTQTAPNIPGISHTPSSAVWDGTRYIMVTRITLGGANSGAVYTSSTATTWDSSIRTPPGVLNMTSSAFGHGLFMSIFVDNLFANATDSLIHTSTDRITWTARFNATFNARAIASSGTTSVAVGNSGGIVSSTDGISWTTRTSGTTTALAGVIWTGSRFVAWGGSAATNIVLTSADGISWAAASGVPTASGSISWVASNGSTTLLQNGTNIHRSTDNGQSWTLVSTAGASANCAWNGTVFAAAQFANVQTSPDGITWTSRPAISGWNLNIITASGGVFIAADNFSNENNRIAISIDNGVTWTSVAQISAFSSSASIMPISFAVDGSTVLIGGARGAVWSTGLPNITTSPVF